MNKSYLMISLATLHIVARCIIYVLTIDNSFNFSSIYVYPHVVLIRIKSAQLKILPKSKVFAMSVI